MMIKQMRFRNLQLLQIFMAAAWVLNGCAHTHMIPAGELPPYSGDRITVFLGDGRVIKYDNKSYHIDSTGGIKTLKGEGWLVDTSSWGGMKPFSGSIAFTQIDSIQASHFSGFSEAMGIILVSAFVSVMLLLLWFSQYHISMS